MFDQSSFLNKYGIPGTQQFPQASGMMFRGFAPQTPPAPVPSKTDRIFDFLGQAGDTLMALSGSPGAVALAQQHANERRLQQQDQLQNNRLQLQQQGQMQQWIAQQEWKRANPEPVQPHYWETNDGSLGIVGPDGKPQILYQDPTPKVNWITADNPDGTKSVIPVGPNGPLNAQQPSRPAIGAVIKDPRKGGSGSGQSGFRTPGSF